MSVTISDLGKDELAEFVTSVAAMDSRRKQAAKRFEIFHNNLAPWVRHYIDVKYHNWKHIAELRKFAEEQPVNPFRMVCDLVCGTTYSTPVRRFLDGGTEAENARLTNLLREAKLKIKAETFLTHAWALSVVIVLPRIGTNPRTGAPLVMLDMVAPHQAEVITSPMDPTQIDVLGYLHPDGTVCVVDPEAFYVFDDKAELLSVSVHGVGEFPGVAWRLDDPITGFWSHTRKQPLVDGTVQYGHVAAVFEYVRKAQNRKLPLAVIDKVADKVPAQQFANLERPLIINTNPNAADIEVLDFDTSPEHFIAHLKNKFESMIKSELGAVDFNPSDGNLTVWEQHRISEARRRQIPYLEQAETELAFKLAMMLWQHPDRENHPNAVSPLVVEERYRVVFPELSFVEEPKARLEVWKEKMKLGVATRIDLLREMFPGKSDDAYREMLVRMAQQEAEYFQIKAAHNLPADPVEATETANMTVPQIQGRQGGLISQTSGSQ